MVFQNNLSLDVENISDEDKSEPNYDCDDTIDIESEVPRNESRVPQKVVLPPKKPALKRKGEDPRIQEAYNILQREETKKKDESEKFADYTAEKLRKLKHQTRAILQHQIHKLIFIAEMEEHKQATLPNSPNSPNSPSSSTTSWDSRSSIPSPKDNRSTSFD